MVMDRSRCVEKTPKVSVLSVGYITAFLKNLEPAKVAPGRGYFGQHMFNTFFSVN